MLSWMRLWLLRHFLSSQRPPSTREDELYLEPMCGELRLMNVKNLLEYSDKCGSDARIIIPPREWPMKEIFETVLAGQNEMMYCLTSVARRSPISKMSPSVCSSLEVELRTMASGC